MGVLDAPSAGFGRPRGLDAALAEGRFGLAILDYKVQWGEWPTLLLHYHVVDRLRIGVDAARSFSGADTAPLYVLRPRPPGMRVVWAPAFATTDVETRREAGELRLGGGALVFDLAGTTDERGCHVDLYVEDRRVRSVTGPGGSEPVRVTWDVREYAGLPARIEAVDETTAGHLRLDEVWAGE
jgi:hypothetical protein